MVDPAESMLSAPVTPRPISRGRILLFLGLAALALGGAVTLYRWKASLKESQDAMVRGDLRAARNAAERYLRLAPGHAEARMLAGDAYLQDDSLDPLEAAEKAINHYSRIPDSSDQGSRARLLEGRAAFLIRQEPARAERLFRRSIELHPDQFDAYYLLWQLDNMTERYFEAEPLFREVYRLCPEEERAFRLREWYSSQFTPLSSCGQLDLMMTYRAEAETPSEEVALRRLSAFREYEPHEPDTVAALAQWHLRNQSRESAIEVLESIPQAEAALQSPFYQATLIETLIEVGQMERAGAEFSKWTSPIEGYHALRIAAIHAQEVDGDLDRAVTFLKRAVATWPGPSDWLLMNRLSRCLALQGQRDESQRVHLEAKRIEGLTDVKAHHKVREALGQLDDPDKLEEVVRFYEAFHRDWEVTAWKEVIQHLKNSPPGRPVNAPQN